MNRNDLVVGTVGVVNHALNNFMRNNKADSLVERMLKTKVQFWIRNFDYQARLSDRINRKKSSLRGKFPSLVVFLIDNFWKFPKNRHVEGKSSLRRARHCIVNIYFGTKNENFSTDDVIPLLGPRVCTSGIMGIKLIWVIWRLR